MSKTKLKIRLFTIVDYEKEQKWLEEMHRQGWRYFRKPRREEDGFQ